MSASDEAQERFVLGLIAADPWRMKVLQAVRNCNPPDWWVGAGFVRNLVWDALHELARPTPLADIDVLYFDPDDLTWAGEDRHEQALRGAWPAPPWSVRNQARMHLRNDDPPYRDTVHAMTFWLETATAVAVRLEADNRLRLAAPLGLDDLLGLRLRPAPAGMRRGEEYRARLESKGWDKIWPRLEVDLPPNSDPNSAIDGAWGNR